MSLEAAITFTIAIFIFGITPGPGLFAVLARALNSGAKSCIPLSFGMAISDVVYLVLATYGLAVIAENYSALFMAIRLIGAAYLMYLGWKMWIAKVDEEIQGNKFSRSTWLSSLLQGFLISMSNPKVILFYIAFLPTFIDLTKLSVSDVVIASALTLFALMVSLNLVAVMASSVRKYLKSQKALQRLNRTAGGIMIGAGIYLVSKGMN